MHEEFLLKLSSKVPNLEIIQCGTPNEAMDLTKSTKLNCVSIRDYINISRDNRLAMHIACFKSSDLVLGPMSGAILASLATGSPSMC